MKNNTNDIEKSIFKESTHKSWKDIYDFEVPDLYDDLLYDYQKKMTKEYLGAKSSNSAVSTANTLASAPSTYSVDLTRLKTMINGYYNGYKYYDTWNDYEKPNAPPRVDKTEKTVDVVMDDGSVESILREDLIKYISEQQVVRENEVVRKVYERYQVAVKLVRSDDNGDTGV